MAIHGDNYINIKVVNQMQPSLSCFVEPTEGWGGLQHCCVADSKAVCWQYQEGRVSDQLCQALRDEHTQWHVVPDSLVLEVPCQRAAQQRQVPSA